MISFITNDLESIIKKLADNGIAFTGPKPSHLGMRTIEFTDPNGHLIRINEPGDSSPSWLQA